MSAFEKILRDGISRGHIPAKTQSAREWYRQAAKSYNGRIRGGDGPNAGRVDYGRINERSFLNQNSKHLTTTIVPGKMYMFHYDPKYRETLPFYDRFPLIFPFRVKPDRFWGINLHYLPLPLRARLMDELYKLTNNRTFDESTKIEFSYKLLTSAAKYKGFEPCVKQYLKSHVETQFLNVSPEYWDAALFLPLERFSKATKSQVWSRV